MQQGRRTYLEADISNLTLLRVSGKENNSKVDWTCSMIKTGDQTFNPNLFDGDIIKIPKLANTKTSEDIPNNLTPEKINIYVVGEVERQECTKFPLIHLLIKLSS